MWEWLFRVHYLHADPPAPLLRAALARRPLPAVLPFLPFVQREWEGFVTSNDRTRSPSGVPFPERRVAVYLDGLFTEGLLRPVEANLPASSPRWLLAGTKRLSLEEQARRFATEHALQEYPGAGDGYGRWFDALPQICQAVGAAQLADLPPRADHQAEFELWLRGSYASLTAASHRPLMTHHVIGRVLTDAAESRRTLLVVVDGLRMDQWLWALQAHPQSWSDIAHTQALIAWVPTVTSLARQAIFAGKPPAAFADHWSTTAHEEAHFRGHFEGVHAQYFKQGSRPLVDFLREVRQDARAAHLAVVVNAVDDLVHASAGDIGELHRDVIRLLGDRLLPWLGEWLGLGYTVHLTSDHGHAVATARVRRDAQLKVFGGTQAQRALIIEDPSSMALELALRPDGTELWQSTGLPPGLRFVLASHSHHFAPHGGPLVAHGGCSLEEVVVPYARIGG
ncbi:MAG: PglZ domain-containing protein [Meiothermus sp.]|nr:PglZ domain-containing protein [Meiothermus sp.]